MWITGLQNFGTILIKIYFRDLGWSFKFGKTPITLQSDETELLHLIQKIPKSEDAGRSWLLEWTAIEDNEECSKQDIVSMVQVQHDDK